MGFNATTKQVTSTIRKIDGRALRNHIQTACCHVVGHAMEYGHSPLANALGDQMQTIPMLRKLAPLVMGWLTSNGPFNYSKDTGFVFSKAKRDAMNEEGYDFDSFVLECEQWDDQSKADKKVKPFDVLKELERLADRAEKKQIAGLAIDAELIPYLRALAGQYAGKKVLAAAAAKAETISVRDETIAVEVETVSI